MKNIQNIIRKTTALTLKTMLIAAVLMPAYTIGGPSTVSAQNCNNNPATTFGQVTQSVSVTTAGTYRVWSRIKAPNTANNSYYFQVNGECAINVGDASSIPANTWTWVNYKDGNTGAYIDVALSAGTHQLKYTGKEADVQLDRILLVSDTSCVPTGTGDNCANADSISPTTSITSPSNGTNAAVGSTVTINADASDNVGVTKVEFYVDGALKGSDTTSPYSYSWNTAGVAAGAHSLTVRAFDAAGNSGTSAAITVNLTASNSGNGDANNDGRVNAIDLSVVISKDGQNYPAADFDGNGTVGAGDLAIVLGKWTW